MKPTLTALCVCLLLLCMDTRAQVNLSQGLLAYFPFSGNANDASGNNFHGSAQNGIQLTTDKYGNPNSAYRFDGVDDHIIVNDNGGLSPQRITVVAWVYPESANAQSITGKIQKNTGFHSTYHIGINYDVQAGFFWGLAPPNSACNQQIMYNPNNPFLTSPDFFSINTWHCVVGIFEDSVQKLYVDGVLVKSKKQAFKNLDQCTNTNFLIGRWWDGDPIPFKGKIDEVRVYNRALNQQEVNALCESQPCTNWLGLPSQPSAAVVGDLDVPGTKITVEAMITRTLPYSGGNLFAGDVVTKHDNPNDCNYLLRPNSAEITTSNGYFRTPEICPIELNKTYHIAMVYDGSTLKYYRNGFLMSQTPASGSLFQNNWPTRIGWYASQVHPTQMIGYVNEVRIWNVARTQDEIKAFMNSSLPPPAAQTGLMAYYTFDNLLNKQGNPAWNASLAGGAVINQFNPSCAAFTPDSCRVLTATGTPISGIINAYTEVLAFEPCNNTLRVQNSAGYNVGDTVLLIQMKGAYIDSTNSASFGAVTNYRNVGNYEFNYISAKNGDLLTLKNKVERSYDIPDGRVQLVRVPYYHSARITGQLTALPWDGGKGGVLVLNARDTINLLNNIDASGTGFKGGKGRNRNVNVTTCGNNEFIYPSTDLFAAQKGESITSISNNISHGKGAPASAGGGGQNHNSGGGGGSNSSAGGFGGYQFDGCVPLPFDNRGLGGHALTYSNAANTIFMGGGGGAGDANNPPGFSSDGGSGGGIIILMANYIKTNGFVVRSNGADGQSCPPPSQQAGCHEGMGGGGGGGAIIADINTYLDNTSLIANGGKGANMVDAFGKLGPGGGGGGGVAWLKQGSAPANVSLITTGGLAGVNTNYANDAWGATAGQDGLSLFDAVIPVTSVLYRKNIDSVRMKDTASCNVFNFKGLAYTNTSAIASWEWSFGDGGTATTQDATHTYANAGPFTVKLVVTDLNGCKDSITKQVTPVFLDFDFSYKQDVCNPLSVQFFPVGKDSLQPYWSFGDGNTVTGNTRPVHTYSAFGDYVVKYAVTKGTCTDTITKTIPVNVVTQNIILTPDTTICRTSAKQLRTAAALNFCWSPTTYLSDPSSPNPVTSTPQNITYYFTAEVTGSNLIVNGDFSAANTGFTSAYAYKPPPNTGEGQYFVGTSPQTWNGGLTNCGDHTSGNGNMMLVNGSITADVNVWTQAINVTPNTNYAFSTWIQSLHAVNPAKLQFAINGRNISGEINASTTCTWSRFHTTWNSGNSTTATISIVNRNTQLFGNDFALDDISFAPVFIQRDSVRITVETPDVRTNEDTAFCPGGSVQLNTSGAAFYSWSPPTGLSNAAVANPLASPLVSTKYYVTGTTASGCTARDSVTVTVRPRPAISITDDTLVCKNASVQLQAGGGTSYVWSPAATLSNSNIYNPVALPAADTKYIVLVSDANGCTNTDSVLVSIRPDPNFTVAPAAPMCEGESTRLNAAGGNSYLWSPAAFVDNPGAASPMASPDGSMVFSVYIRESQCNRDTTLEVSVVVNESPLITARKANDIDCSTPSAALQATGATSYVWSPATGLDDPRKSDPITSASATTFYTVTGTNQLGCSGKDTITVKVTNGGRPVFELPNAFTPNGDRKNDCFGIRKWAQVNELEFTIYNRWGQKVFSTSNPSQCWDGTLNGKPQDSGGFVYMIRAKSACGEVIRKGMVLLIR